VGKGMGQAFAISDYLKSFWVRAAEMLGRFFVFIRSNIELR
jgi:hypothetical protein